jgi:phosphodiester glycosidase
MHRQTERKPHGCLLPSVADGSLIDQLKPCDSGTECRREVQRQHVRQAVAVNAAMFASHSPLWVRLPGDLASGVETLVADHVVSHVWEYTYLLWFDDQLTPHLRPSKPPPDAELARAKWGVGGQNIWLKDGRIWPGSDRRPDARTAVGIDGERKLLFLAVADNISPRLTLQKLAALGACDGMLLDGGGSSAMAIGEGAKGVRAGGVYGGWRPVATYFGVRAQQLQGKR